MNDGNETKIEVVLELIVQAGTPIVRRTLPDGRYADVMPNLFGTARLCVGTDPKFPWYDDVWCFRSLELAVETLKMWDGQGEPPHWFRHPTTGRYQREEMP